MCASDSVIRQIDLNHSHFHKTTNYGSLTPPLTRKAEFLIPHRVILRIEEDDNVVGSLEGFEGDF